MNKPNHSKTHWVLAGALATVLFAGVLPAHADVKDVYKVNCKKCHGWDGKGDTPQGRKEKAADWTTAAFQKRVTDDQIVKTILEGKESDGKKMKGLKDKVSPAEAKELVKIVRAFGSAPGPFPGEK